MICFTSSSDGFIISTLDRIPDNSDKYMKTVVAFGNTQGGKLIIGVDDRT